MQKEKMEILDFLPKDFIDRIIDLLGDKSGEFLKSYNESPSVGVRWNRLFCDKETFLKKFPFKVLQTAHCDEGFLLNEKRGDIGKSPYHHAGMYYLQEPSAMAPVVVLDPKPGERVLDLCAAPGGKSTQIAARMEGKGVLVSNEIVRSRAQILISNIERLGVSNAVVLNTSPTVIEKALPYWFDKVLVDAPCSGEGMFRKNPNATSEWSSNYPKSCATRQKEILNSAAKLVRLGGILVYSTCTFSLEENEEQIFGFLKEHPDFELEDISISIGTPSYKQWLPEFKEIEKCRRIFPFNGGEGHFIAKLRRIKGKENEFSEAKWSKNPPEFNSFWKETFCSEVPSNLLVKNNQVFILPQSLPKNLIDLSIRPGILAGEVKKNRFIPAHHLSHANFEFKKSHKLCLSLNDEETLKYLKGEQLECAMDLDDGYCGVFVDGFPLGFAKKASLKLKNHYPKGLRRL